MGYLLDANVMITAQNLHYGFDFCPGFWDWLLAAHDAGRVFSVEKVGDEVLGLGDELSDWALARGEEQKADYYLVAQARAGGHTVVTHEVPSGSTRKIKIPDVCIGLGIKCMTPFQMLRLEGARLVLESA